MGANPDPSTLQRNRLLNKLPAADYALLRPHLELVPLVVREALAEAAKPIEHLDFVVDGIASIVTAVDWCTSVEIGVIGREGVSGVAAILGGATSPHSTFVHVGGSAWRITAKSLTKLLERSETLRGLLLRYAHVFMVQMADTAAANAKASIEERLARQLLMAHDRLDGDELPLTHEVLAVMLGTRRPGVTAAMHSLVKRGLIRANRGTISVVDREGLARRAGGFYGTAEAEYQRQIG